MRRILWLLLGVLFWSNTQPVLASEQRADGAILLPILLEGSLQNPVFSPSGTWVLFTRFRDGYNRGASDLYVYHLPTGALRPLVSDGSSNVNLPGASWSDETDMIVFSSDRGGADQIFMTSSNAGPGEEIQLTDRPGLQAYEPSFSPDGDWVIFESHVIDQELAVITKFQISSGDYVDFSPDPSLAKQPNWSPDGAWIVFQAKAGSRQALYIADVINGEATRISPPGISATDAVFSQDGTRVIFSGEAENLRYANIFSLTLQDGELQQLTDWDGYDGAVSISPDGRRLAFESSPTAPDNSAGTRLWMLTLSD